MICIHVGTAPESLLDFLLDVGGFDARLDFDVVDNALYTLYGARCSFGRLPLILPLNIPFKGDPTVLTTALICSYEKGS